MCEYTVEGDIFKVNSDFVISKVIDLNYYILLVLVNSLNSYIIVGTSLFVKAAGA